ncbi:MAG: UDP-N-acetylglucosamine:undecaprenyl-P N-acetylglucosaminyl 1-P transferase [Anaerolineaceae bacterium]|nr:MAG: UDP-N-acetylglucosamine:undecaprenyl-P N-acetylglucosaminyl 1-P transferase [Anaerolineaceae bacterium]
MSELYPVSLFVNILAGLVLALGFGLAAMAFARRFGPMDVPGSQPHKKHDAPVPLAGGLALVAALAAGSLLFNLPMLRDLWRILVPALLVFAIALWDDYKGLPAGVKLAGQVLAGVLLIVFGVYVQILKPGFLGLGENVLIWFNWFITLFWIVGITNAMNLIDSMDGIVAGTSSVAVAFMILVTLGAEQDSLLRLLTLMLGIGLGLYFFNTPPARFFLGDSGAQTIGFLLAAVSILFTPEGYPQASAWFLPILILGVPIFDTTLVVFSRLRRRLPPHRGGLDHTYHRLVKLGLDSNRAVVLMHLATVALGCIAFLALRLEPLYANLVFLLVCLAGAAIIIYLDHRHAQP